MVKKHGLRAAFRYSLIVFSVGMLIMYVCCMYHTAVSETALTFIALGGGILVSFALGSFFSITYTVPTHLARRELLQNGKDVASKYFAVQGLFEGVAAGIATGIILVTLKSNDVIQLLPIIVCVACAIAFVMTFWLPKALSNIGKGKN